MVSYQWRPSHRAFLCRHPSCIHFIFFLISKYIFEAKYKLWQPVLRPSLSTMRLYSVYAVASPKYQGRKQKSLMVKICNDVDKLIVIHSRNILIRFSFSASFIPCQWVIGVLKIDKTTTKFLLSAILLYEIKFHCRTIFSI